MRFFLLLPLSLLLLLSGRKLVAQAEDLTQLQPVTECLDQPGPDCEKVLDRVMKKTRQAYGRQKYFDFLMQSAHELCTNGHFTLALRAIYEAQHISRDSLPLLASAYRRTSVVYLYQGSLDSALEYAEKSLQLYTRLKDSVSTGILLVSRGQVFKELGKYPEAMEDYLKAIRIFKQLHSSRYVARTQTEMATLAAVTGDVDKALKYNKQAADYYQSSDDQSTYAYIILNMANDLIYTGREDTALSLLNRAIPIFKNDKKLYLWMNAEAQLGRAFHQIGQPQRAIRHLKRSIDLGQGQSFVSQLAYNHEYLARVYRELGNHPAALEHSRQALMLHRQMGMNEEYRAALQELAMNYEAQGRPDSALKYFRQFMEVSDSLFSLQKEEQLNELKVRYETDIKEEQIKAGRAEIGLLEQQNSAQRSRSLALGLSLLIVLMTGIGIISRQRTKVRLNRQLISQREKAYLAEMRLKSEEEKRLRADLEHKKRELASQALLMAEKNEMLRSFKEQLYEVSERLEESTILNQVVQRMERAENKTQDWDKFMQIFEDVHPDFLEKLRKDFGKLTNNDLRLIVLMKMNFSNKEISSILHVSEAGLKKARYRLRKKLGLASEDNMHDHIHKL